MAGGGEGGFDDGGWGGSGARACAMVDDGEQHHMKPNEMKMQMKCIVPSSGLLPRHVSS